MRQFFSEFKSFLRKGDLVLLALCLAVTTFGVMPYKSAAESTNRFLAQANAYLADGCYNFAWVTNYQPNVDDYRAVAVAAINAYNADPTDANWATVVTAFIDGWATQYALANG